MRLAEQNPRLSFFFFFRDRVLVARRLLGEPVERRFDSRANEHEHFDPMVRHQFRAPDNLDHLLRHSRGLPVSEEAGKCAVVPTGFVLGAGVKPIHTVGRWIHVCCCP